jgi:hypothetical protein
MQEPHGGIRGREQRRLAAECRRHAHARDEDEQHPEQKDRAQRPGFSSSAFAAHTNADHVHQTSAGTIIPCAKPVPLRSFAISVVTCVTAKTNTRSHSSSTGSSCAPSRSDHPGVSFAGIGNATSTKPA